jgi:hypothetical protein
MVRLIKKRFHRLQARPNIVKYAIAYPFLARPLMIPSFRYVKLNWTGHGRKAKRKAERRRIYSPDKILVIGRIPCNAASATEFVKSVERGKLWRKGLKNRE